MPRNINLKKASGKNTSVHTDERDLEQRRLERSEKRRRKRRGSRPFMFLKKLAHGAGPVFGFFKKVKRSFLDTAYNGSAHRVKTVNIRNTSYAYRIRFFVKHSLKVLGMTIAGVFRICAPVVVPVLGIAIILGSALFFSKYSPALQVVMNETPIDVYVKDESELERIRTEVSDAVFQMRGGEYAVEQYASQKLVIVERSKLSDYDEAYNAVFELTSQAAGMSYGIYVDNVFIGSLSRMEEVNRLEDDLLAICTNGNNTQSKLLSTIVSKRGEYPPENQMTYAEMLLYFNRKTVDGTAFLHPVSYETVRKEISTVRLPAGEPTTVDDPSLYEGLSVREKIGSDGYVTSEVTITEQNGTEVRREAAVISKVEPVSGVIRVGSKKIAPSGYFMWPVGGDGGYVSSGFGYRTLYGFSGYHRGLDIAADYGTPIYAAEAGTIIFFGWDPNGLGNCVRIDHGTGIYTSYGHCSSLAAGLSVGMRVPQGQVIAYVGKSGSATGSHLHIAMSTSTNFGDNGVYIDPLKYLRR